MPCGYLYKKVNIKLYHMTNVKKYTTEQLLDRVKSLKDFNDFPTGFWLLGVRSNEDAFNEMDDKFYLMQGEKSVFVFGGTTNAGKTGLLGFEGYNKDGCAVLQADNIVYDYYEQGYHKGKVWALRQAKGFPYMRDNDKDKKAEDKGGVIHTNIIYANFHPASYVAGSMTERRFIDGWSLACQVTSVRADFDKVMRLLGKQKKVTYALLNEF